MSLEVREVLSLQIGRAVATDCLKGCWLTCIPHGMHQAILHDALPCLRTMPWPLQVEQRKSMAYHQRLAELVLGLARRSGVSLKWVLPGNYMSLVGGFLLVSLYKHPTKHPPILRQTLIL